MLDTTRCRALVFLLILPPVLLPSGCNRKPSYVPSATSGRQALETALNAWQNGQKVGTIETASAPVQVVDSGWGKGQKLTGYEIVEEVPRDDGRRCFKVRLQFQEASDIQEVHYLVVGRSPLWIFREDDYKSYQNWGGGSGAPKQ
jgi:hypothetical protein